MDPGQSDDESQGEERTLRSHQEILVLLLNSSVMKRKELLRSELVYCMNTFAKACAEQEGIDENDGISEGEVVITSTKILARANTVVEQWPACCKVVLQTGERTDVNGVKIVSKRILGLVTHVGVEVESEEKAEADLQGERPPSPPSLPSSESQQAKEESSKSTPKSRLTCNECKKTFSKPSIVTRHIKTHEGGDKICALCGARFRNITSLTKHGMLIHY